jgi:hypothetical protein
VLTQSDSFGGRAYFAARPAPETWRASTSISALIIADHRIARGFAEYKSTISFVELSAPAKPLWFKIRSAAETKLKRCRGRPQPPTRVQPPPVDGPKSSRRDRRAPGVAICSGATAEKPAACRFRDEA